jgi:hypothetical protein
MATAAAFSDTPGKLARLSHLTDDEDFREAAKSLRGRVGHHRRR